MPRPARSTGTTTTSVVTHAAVGGSQRRGDDGRGDRNIAQGLRGQQHADPVRRATKSGRGGPRVAQFTQGIVDERMIDELQRHAPILVERVGRKGTIPE